MWDWLSAQPPSATAALGHCQADGERRAWTGVSVCVSVLKKTKHIFLSLRVTCISCPGLPVRVPVHFLLQLYVSDRPQGFTDGGNRSLPPVSGGRERRTVIPKAGLGFLPQPTPGQFLVRLAPRSFCSGSDGRSPGLALVWLNLPEWRSVLSGLEGCLLHQVRAPGSPPASHGDTAFFPAVSRFWPG